jgi:hypothetical protein
MPLARKLATVLFKLFGVQPGKPQNVSKLAVGGTSRGLQSRIVFIQYAIHSNIVQINIK